MGFKPAKTQINTQINSPSQVLDLKIEPGTSPKGVAQAIADAGGDAVKALIYVTQAFAEAGANTFRLTQ